MSHIKPAHFSHTYITPNPNSTKIKPNNNTKTTLSQKIPMRKQFVTYIPNITPYRKTVKLALTEESIQKIHMKLEVDAQAERQFERRIKTNDLYVNYNKNPLSDLKPQTINGHAPQRNIIDHINNIKLKNSTLDLTNRLQTPRTPTKDLYVKMDNERKREGTRKGLKEKENIIFAEKRTYKEYIKTDFQILDDIVNQNDRQYFETKFRRVDKNIFHLLSSKNAHKFRNNKEILEQFYFCFDSIISLTQKDSIVNYSLQEISVFSRQMARNHITSKIPESLVLAEGDFNLDMDRLQFDEIMLIAANRLLPKTLIRYFHEDDEQTHRKKTVADEDSMVQVKKEVSIWYPDNTANRQEDFNPSSHGQAEIEYYNKSVMSGIEKRQNELSQKYQDKLKRLIEMERLSISCAIEDRNIMRQFKEQKDEALLMGLDSNVDKRLKLTKETERKIRMNKMNKNRTEKIKIDILSQSFKLKKRLEAKGTKRSGSISPTVRERSANK